VRNHERRAIGGVQYLRFHAEDLREQRRAQHVRRCTAGSERTVGEQREPTAAARGEREVVRHDQGRAATARELAHAFEHDGPVQEVEVRGSGPDAPRAVAGVVAVLEASEPGAA